MLPPLLTSKGPAGEEKNYTPGSSTIISKRGSFHTPTPVAIWRQFIVKMTSKREIEALKEKDEALKDALKKARQQHLCL